MILRATLGAAVVAAAAFTMQPTVAKADGEHYKPAHHHYKKAHHYVVHKPAPVATYHHEHRRFCLLDWFRHRHAAPVYAPAPKVYVHKVHVKKHVHTAYTPLK